MLPSASHNLEVVSPAAWLMSMTVERRVTFKTFEDAMAANPA